MRYVSQIMLLWLFSFQWAFANIDTYQTKKGDTLLKIAEKLQDIIEDDLTNEQLALALYKNNSQAFQSCNLFSLKIGATLRIPTNLSAINATIAATEIKRQQKVWKTAKGKISKLICPEMPLSSAIELSSTLETMHSNLLPILEDESVESVNDCSQTLSSMSLLPMLALPFKSLIYDLYVVELIDNFQDLPSLELIKTTPFEELPMPAKSLKNWQVGVWLSVTLGGFLWGFLQYRERQALEIAHAHTDNLPAVVETPFVVAVEESEEPPIEMAVIVEEPPLETVLEGALVDELEEEKIEEPPPVIVQPSFESILEDAFQNWETPINSITPSNTEEILSNEELAQWATNEPVIDRQILDKIFN